YVCRLSRLSLSGPSSDAAYLSSQGGESMKSVRFWVVVAILASTVFVLQSRGDVDRVPYSQPLSMMPRSFGAWTAQDIPLTDDTLEVLGKGDFLNRVYTFQPQPAEVPRPAISVFIGYFASQ